MKKTRKKGIRSLAILLVLVLTLGFSPVTNVEAKAAPRLNYKKVTLVQGKKKRLKVRNLSRRRKVKWYSTKKSVATVNKKGVVKAKKKGKTYIVAKVGKKKYRCKVIVKKKVTKKKAVKKTPVVTIEPTPKSAEPEIIVRPTPKKVKQWTKEEKVLYKKLDESFSTVANMAMVIEERTMDTKNMPNLTIGEIHLIEMVNRYNNKPMTLIANKLHITVGAMTICLNRLVQKGYVLRTRDEMDRRVILLSVTPEGKKILKFHNKFHDDILGIVLDTIPLAQATKVMSQFAYVLEYYFDPSIALVEEKKTSKKEKNRK